MKGTCEFLHRVDLHVHNMFEKGQINEDICKYLSTDINRTQLFYTLPKIHKGLDNLPDRPTVSSSGGLTEKFPLFVDQLINPLVPLAKSFIRYSTHLINILKDFGNLPDDTVLCTALLRASKQLVNY